MSSSTEASEPGFLLTSFALFGGVVLWMVHLLLNSALVAASCAHGVTWLLNLSTAVTAVGAALSVVAAAVLIRRHTSPIGQYSGRTHLLGFLGAFFGVSSVMLILLEGAPVLVINACRR